VLDGLQCCTVLLAELINELSFVADNEIKGSQLQQVGVAVCSSAEGRVKTGCFRSQRVVGADRWWFSQFSPVSSVSCFLSVFCLFLSPPDPLQMAKNQRS